MEKVYDVAIIGGGPAGSTVASYLAKQGISCIIFEKEIFPRPHVGESLVPSVNRILHDLDVFKEMDEVGFLKKTGAAWTTNNSVLFNHNYTGIGLNDEVSILFNERKSDFITDDYTYHVDRSKFDHMLLKKAAFYGCEVLEGASVSKVDFGCEDYVVIQSRRNGEALQCKAKMVVDASGRGTLLGRQLKTKETDPWFNQFAVHAWYKNFDRKDQPLSDYIFIHFLPYSRTWIWQIPITQEITSIGLVTSKKHLDPILRKPEDIFSSFLSKNLELADRISSAERVTDFRVESDYSYTIKDITGDRFVLIGDAARYVDPIFSSGVSIALTSAKLAAKAISGCISEPYIKKENFDSYRQVMQRGCKNWYEFIYMYYRLNVLFTYFISSPKYRLEVIRFLQGDVYDEEESFLLKDMKAMLRDIENTPDHIWHKLLQEVG